MKKPPERQELKWFTGEVISAARMSPLFTTLNYLLKELAYFL
jgi:hypothetical protein